MVSAMGRKGEPYATDTLISLLKDLGERVNLAELDSVMSIGEILSSAYFFSLAQSKRIAGTSLHGQYGRNINR